MSITTKDDIRIDQQFYGEATMILSKRGYGKSYLARVLIEEGQEKGIPFIVIDPQDAYLNLDNFSYIDVRRVKSARGLAQLLAQTHQNVVIQVKRLTPEQQNLFVKTFLEEYKLRLQKGIQTIVIDEMHKFAPESEKTLAKETIRAMFQENRSDGLGIIGISQRPQRVDKTCLSQADHLGIGKLTSMRDLDAIKGYLDDEQSIEQIKKLNKGSFLFYGFNNDHAIISKVRIANTTHSGGSPTNLLSNDQESYTKNLSRFYKGDKTMSDTVSTESGTLNKFVPSVEGFKDLALLGAKVSVGRVAGGFVGELVASRFNSPIPYVSSRTLGGAASTIVLYSAYRMIDQPTAKDVLKYAAAGSAVYTAGSLVFDLVNASKVSLPNIVSFGIATATGASPVVVSGSPESDVDLNTQFR